MPRSGYTRFIDFQRIRAAGRYIILLWILLSGTGEVLVSTDLGEIKKVGVKNVWAHEEQDFTPWLAKEENIAKLSREIGLELQVERIEVPVGPYSADILAKETSGSFVVIENQFGKTDHDHLGKVLTYAATLGATSVIWIAERFTDEHRKVIEWLNEHTSVDLGLYAVEIELWQIDSSKPAVRFNVLSKPTEIARQAIVAKSAGPLSDARKLQLEFWTEFRDKLLERKVVPSAQTPRPQYWFDVALGRANIYLSNIANTSDGRIGVRVYIGKKIAEAALPQLVAERAAIEAEIGEQLQWNPNPDNDDKTIGLSRDADLYNRDNWPEYISWLVDKV
jgi:hypothetical protein